MAAYSDLRKSIRPEMTVRQVAADFPASQAVFRVYGELDAPPAKFGHLEPLTHFARRRGVALEKLLAELSAASGVPVELQGRLAETVHHGFITSALVLTLTLGAGWGAWLLWQIGTRGRFSGASDAQIIAHGEAQLWGFVALLVIGISLRTALQGALRQPLGIWICRGLLALGLVGVGGSVLWSLFPARLASLGILSAAALGLMSLGLFGMQIVLLRPKWRATWARAILASGLWLSVWAAATALFRWNAGVAGPGAYSSGQRMLLIELAVFGFAMNSIYGFGQMLLPGLLRIGKVRDREVELAHWVHNAGAALLCLTTWLGTRGGGAVLGSALLVVAAVLFAVGHRGFVGRRRASLRDEQGHAPLDFYPPLAFGWLLAALLLMAGGALYEAIAAQALPHAYVGAMRHALTVGFMTTLILGVAQRLVPVLDRTVLAMPALAVPILALIGAGNLLRVGSQLATLATPLAYHVMPYSAFLEWSALLLFAISMMATMYHRDALLTRGRVTQRSSLAVLLAEYPWIEDRLRSGGTRYLERTRSVPPELTFGSFAASEGYNAAELIARINGWLAEIPRERGPGGQSRLCEAQELELER